MHLPLAIPFIAILCGCLVGTICDEWILWVSTPLLVGLAWFFHRTRSAVLWLYFVRTGVLFLSFFSLGVFSSSFYTAPPEFQDLIISGELEILGKVQNKAKVSRAFARIELIDTLGRQSSVQVLLVYFPDSGFKGLQTGEVHHFQGNLRAFSELKNPGNFDARGYYRHLGLSGELIADSLKLVVPAAVESNLRDRGKELLSKQLEQLPDEQSKALFTALLSGDKQHLDSQIREAFARCGMMHLLAVSGLHTGLLVVFPLWWLRKSRRTVWRIIALLLALSIVWSFAWFTGFPASVRRAATMLSLLCVGLTLKKRTSGLNLMFGAGVLMLTDDPSLVKDIGFQLSFAAVAAILYWGPLISSWIETRWRWVNRFVASPAAVSIAAQAGTTPFSLYYFHQFPLLFLPVNLIAVPYATLLLYGMILRLLLASAGIHPPHIDAILSSAAMIMLESAIAISEIEWSAIDSVEISSIEAVLWAVVFCLLIRRRPLRNRLQFCALCVSAFIITAVIHLRIDHRPELILFSGMDPPLIGYREGSTSLLIKHYEKQSDWLASGWKKAHCPKIYVMQNDSVISEGRFRLERKGLFITLNDYLLCPKDSLENTWQGHEISWTREKWLINGCEVGLRDKGAIVFRFNSTGQVGAVYAQHRPPIPGVPEGVESD